MLHHPLRKLLGLFVLYTAIIVGIFVLQFRSDSIIRKNIRAMRVTLAETEGPSGTTVLKNSFQLSFNGLLFKADDKSPVIISSASRAVPVQLVSFDQPDPLSYSLSFTDGVTLQFSLSEDSDEASLWVSAKFPEEADSVSVNYSPYSGFSLAELKAKSAVFTGKTDSYSLIAPALNTNEIFFQKNSKSAHYSVMKKQSEFSIDTVEDLAFASKDLYGQTVNAIKAQVVSEFLSAARNNANFAATLSEQTVISFVAAMAESGRYNEALDAVPEAFVKGSRRSYLSAPFFGSLSDMLPTLTMQVENYNSMISRAVQERTLDIWTAENIGPYIYTRGNRGNVALLAAIPASMPNFAPTIDQAAGILRAYAYLREQESSIAKPLEPVLETCAQKILSCCTGDGEKVLLIENDSPVSVLQGASAGDALVLYGRIFGQSKFEALGYLAVNSYAGDTAALDLRATAELYPVLVHGNNYYPHFVLLKTMETENIWAWTSASAVTYSRDENLTISLGVDFPTGLSHYLFVRGITPFRHIQIYNMDFRSDPRFEIYNSSGYVYRNNVQTLLLKSRHRDAHEVVRLFYRDIQEEEPAPEEQEPAPDYTEGF